MGFDDPLPDFSIFSPRQPRVEVQRIDQEFATFGQPWTSRARSVQLLVDAPALLKTGPKFAR